MFSEALMLAQVGQLVAEARERVLGLDAAVEQGHHLGRQAGGRGDVLWVHSKNRGDAPAA